MWQNEKSFWNLYAWFEFVQWNVMIKIASCRGVKVDRNENGKKGRNNKTNDRSTDRPTERDCTLRHSVWSKNEQKWKSLDVEKGHTHFPLSAQKHISFFICVHFDIWAYCTVGRVRRLQPSFSDYRPSTLLSSYHRHRRLHCNGSL